GVLVRLQLGGGRQFAVLQEIGDLEERALGGQLLDRIAPVEENALLAVDVADLGTGLGSVGESPIEGDEPGLCAESPDVDGHVSLRTDLGRQRDFAIFVPEDGFGHGLPFVQCSCFWAASMIRWASWCGTSS